MREILFKAKRVDTGEWVEGFYFCMVHDDGRHIHHFIMPLGVDLSLGTPIEKIQVEIDADTICQYTGLTDKNGNKIWENDIVMLDDELWVVKWSDNDAQFTIEDDCTVEHFGNVCGMDCEVYGNSFDNPELIGE